MPFGFPNSKFSGYSNYGQGTPKDVIVQTSDTELLAPNPARIYMEIINNSDDPIWFSSGVPAVVGEGTRLLGRTGYGFLGAELNYMSLNAIALNNPVSVEIIEGV